MDAEGAGAGAAFNQDEYRRWRKDKDKGIRLRNVKYTASENARLMEAVKEFCELKGTTVDELSMRDEKQAKTWGKIAKMSGIEIRNVQSMSKRVRRVLSAELGGIWTEDQADRLAELVLAGDVASPNWRHAASVIGKSPDQCRDKWRELFGSENRGRWSRQETQALRAAVTTITKDLAPVSDIPWKEISKLVPGRSPDQCRTKWYKDVLPPLLQYQGKHGVPVETDVFLRLIVYNLCALEFEELELVCWASVNPFWPATENKKRFLLLLKSVPEHLVQDGDFQEVVEWLKTSLSVKDRRKRDKVWLKHIRIEDDDRSLRHRDWEADRWKPKKAGTADDAAGAKEPDSDGRE